MDDCNGVLDAWAIQAIDNLKAELASVGQVKVTKYDVVDGITRVDFTIALSAFTDEEEAIRVLKEFGKLVCFGRYDQTDFLASYKIDMIEYQRQSLMAMYDAAIGSYYR